MNVETDTFSERFNRWRECFDGDDGNSITNQVCSML